jgi:hypothetical protein
MQPSQQWTEAFREGLQLLDEFSFPKTCSNCGKTYDTLEEFIAETEPVGHPSGLSEMDFGTRPTIVGLYRNCVCRSTLVAGLKNRRGTSEQAVLAREQFDRLLALLEEQGVPRDVGRRELLKVMDGEESELLKDLGIEVEDMPAEKREANHG